MSVADEIVFFQTMEARLTPQEDVTCQCITRQMKEEILRDNYKSKYGGPGFNYELQLLSVRAECCVAKALNLFWLGNVGFPRSVDVGGVVEVKAKRKVDGINDLIVHEDQLVGREQLFFVNVRPNWQPLSFQLLGWRYGNECRQREWFRGHRGGDEGYWVPEKKLHPMSELVDIFSPKRPMLRGAA